MDTKEPVADDFKNEGLDDLEDVSLKDDENYDRLNLKLKKDCLKMLESQSSSSEAIVYSNHLKKINKRGIEQDRILLITDRAIYNLMPRNPGKCKRRIPIEDIGALTLSTLSDEFVVHVPNEYDYRFKSLEKETIAKVIKQTYQARAEIENQVYGTIRVFPVQKIAERTLKHVTLTKGETKKLNDTIFNTSVLDENKESEREHDLSKVLQIVSDSETFQAERSSTGRERPHEISISFNI